MKCILRFGKKGKLSHRFIGPFEVLEKIGGRANRIALPSNLSSVHNDFHISMLRTYLANQSQILHHEPLELASNISYEERPAKIHDRKLKNFEEQGNSFGESAVAQS